MRLSPLLLLGLCHNALGSGYYFSDSGVISMSQGGAWVASANTPFAQRYNPAALIHITQPTLAVGLSAVQQNTTFTPLVNGALAEPISNQAKPFPVPQIGFAAPLNDKLVFAFGLHSPFAPSANYLPSGAQRYSVIQTTIWHFSVGPSLAWRPIKQLTIGLGLQWSALRIDESLKATTSGDTNPAGDVGITVTSWDRRQLNYNVGLLIDPHPSVSVGLSFQPAIRHDATGSLTVDFSENGLAAAFDTPIYSDPTVALGVTLPMELRFGVALHPSTAWTVELGGKWTRWSQLQNITVDQIDITLTGPLFGSDGRPIPPSFDLPARFSNSGSIRLGGSFVLTPRVTLRAGGMYETSAIATPDLSVALVDRPKVQVGGGLGLGLTDRVLLDLSGAYLSLIDTEVRDSAVKQLNVNDPEGPAAIVGDGDYRSSGWLLGAQTRFLFGAAKSEVLP